MDKFEQKINELKNTMLGEDLNPQGGGSGGGSTPPVDANQVPVQPEAGVDGVDAEMESQEGQASSEPADHREAMNRILQTAIKFDGQALQDRGYDPNASPEDQILALDKISREEAGLTNNANVNSTESASAVASSPVGDMAQTQGM